jgi:hypothetical protein
LACLIALGFGAAAKPASAYVCGRAPIATRTLQGHVGTLKDCDRPAARPKRGNADPMSFVFFIGIMVAFVLVPITLGRREELPPQ